MSTINTLKNTLAQRIMIIDGAMGTMIQKHKLQEADFRGERFKDWSCDLQGNNDILSITQPDIIKNIHLAYLEAGADIVETNTFSSTAIAQADYEMQDLAYELNVASAQLAQKAIQEYYAQHGDSVRKYVAGAIGPMNKTLSLSPDVNNPGFRAVTFDEIAAAYYTQIKGLVDGGADILLVETIFDTLNAKAALFAIQQYFTDTQTKLPIMISGTITDASGRTLSGQTLEAFYISIAHAQPLSVGLNCALGGAQMRPYVQELAQICESHVSCYPNAGLPNAMGAYDESPETTAAIIADFARNGWLNVVGGCCGTTPEHIKAIADAVKSIAPRTLPVLLEA